MSNSFRERPILFQSDMVRALLAGTKTQTRRVCKAAENLSAVVAVQDPFDRRQCPPNIDPGWFGDEDGEVQFYSPFGRPGDQLWVREAWTTHSCFDTVAPRDLTTRSIAYVADGPIQTGKFRPPMFMPRWASRLTLEITDVRVELLQDIRKADAIAEGIVAHEARQMWLYGANADERAALYRRAAINAYRDLWETINGAGSWAANPWVWVVEFKRIPQVGVQPTPAIETETQPRGIAPPSQPLGETK